MSQQLATGITVGFASGFFAQILNVDEDEMTREAIQTSHMGTTGGHTFIPSKLYDPGGVTVEMLHDGEVAPPIQGATEEVSVGYPDGTGYSIDGFMTGYKRVGALEDMIRATARIKFSGTHSNDTTPT